MLARSRLVLQPFQAMVGLAMPPKADNPRLDPQYTASSLGICSREAARKPPVRPRQFDAAPTPGAGYIKSSVVILMAGIPSYLSGSNPFLSNLRLAALSTCDLNRSKFSRAPCKSRTFVGSSSDRAL